MTVGRPGRQLEDVVTPPDRRAAYEAAGLWDGATLAGRVAEHARTDPAATAVIDAAGRHDYASLASDAAACAAALSERGVRDGAVVSVQLPNRYETVVVAVAIQSLGAVINPLLPNYRAHELSGVFSTARPAVVFTPGVHRGFDHRPLVAKVSARTGVTPLHVVVGAGADGGSSQMAFEDLLSSGAGSGALGAGTAAVVSELIFTSGTEARPKAIMHTEQTANFSMRVAHRDLGMNGSDVVWMPSPVGHSTGFNYGTRFALYHGLRLVLQDRWDPGAALDLVDRHGCSYTLAATTFLQDLVTAAETAGRKLPTLRLFGCGGAPVPAALVDAAAEREIGVLRLYGSTEVLVATWNRPESPLAKRRDTDGVTMTAVEIEVRDETGVLGRAGTGELFVRGPDTCVGFFSDPERTAATFDPDGWLRSGDLVTIDEEGYLTVVGRKKEIIIRGGLNIAPREIEGLILDFPEVERVAVVGLPDPRLGERMCACVVLRAGAGLDLDTTVSRLRAAGLATFKLPERLEVLEALPSTASGKVQKHEIVRVLSAPKEEATGG